MIETNIVNWLDLSDSLQYLDVYGKRKSIKVYNFIRISMLYKTFSVFFFIFFKFFFFLQIMMLTLSVLEDKHDTTVVFLKYISTVIFIQEIVDSKSTFETAVLIISILTFVIILCIIYIAFSIKIGKFYLNLPLYFINLVNIVITNYLVGPIIQVSLLATDCKGGKHIYLEVECYKDTTHIVILVFSLLNLVFFFILSMLLSIYYNEIGSVNESKVCVRINCNYELYMNISKIAMFIFAYIVRRYFMDNDYMRLIMQIFIFLNSLFFVFYTYFAVLFYDNRMNIITVYGWAFVAWFAFVIIIKDLLNIYDTSIFHLVGWFIISCVIFFCENYKEEWLLTDFNIFEAKSLKDIELFNIKLFNLINIRSMKNKTMVLGLIEKFERFFKTNPEMNEKYLKLCNDSVLRKKFNASLDLPILSIVFLIYDYHLEKSTIKNDILLVMAYFLMNKFKKVYQAIYLCSKVKVNEHKLGFLKFILLEEIKEYLLNKMTKSNNKESIKPIQIGSVILYNIYTETFRLKIFDAACNQIDYFDTLRNNTTNSKTTQNFLTLGKEILALRKSILKLWDRILLLNPFSDESERDYMMYLETILQDDTLAKVEAKKYTTLKNNKLSERTSMYHSMFIKEVSAVCLVDGYSTLGKLLYVTPNFPTLFGFSGKEILNYGIEDLMPEVIARFHKELIDNAVKFSNVNKIFSGQLDMLFKGKTGGVFNVKIFIKCVPNFSYGLIYLVYVSKIQDHNYIVVLDEEYKINCITDTLSASGTPYVMSSNYGLTNNIIGHHIGTILPDLLTQLEFKDDKYLLAKSEIDLKGNLYPSTATKEIDAKITAVLDKIKEVGRLSNDEDAKKETVAEYEDLIKEITNKYPKPFSVFYRLVTKTFLNGKYKYHRLYITNDLIALNENSHFYNSTGSTGSQGNEEFKEKSIESEAKQKKLIKLKGIGFDTEKKSLLKKNNTPTTQGEMTGKNGTEKDKQKEEKKEDDFKDHNSSSAMTKSSIDSASFNKLKNFILEKREVTSIKIMKYFGFIYGIFTIVFIYLSFSGCKTTFSDIKDYLGQNLFFNHTKISISCVYLSSMNLYWSRYKKIPEDNCYVETCSEFYENLLVNCVLDAKTQKENSSFFYSEFRSILKQTQEISILIDDSGKSEKLSIDVDNLLTLITSTGLDFSSSYKDYISNKTNSDVTVFNLIEQTYLVIDNKNFFGFEEAQRKKNVGKLKSSLSTLSLIFDVIIFVLIVILYSMFIYKLFKMETNYLEMLIKFNSPSFEAYIKKLEELKKKLRNDNGDEEDDKINETEINNLEKSKDKKEEDDKKKDDKKEKDKKKKQEEEEKTLSKKKKREKMSKLQMLKNNKFQIMSRFFFHWNFYFTIRVAFVFIIAVSYFLVSYIVEKSYENDLVDLDSSMESIEAVYKSSFDVFLILKNILSKYVNLEIEKGKGIEYLTNNQGSTYVLDGVEYTFNDIDKMKQVYFQMDIPGNTELQTPKLGNLLMPILNNGNLNKEGVEQLSNLYNSDACSVLFAANSKNYTECSAFWSSILMKGMEQSITQMSVVINSVIDELNALNLGNKKLEDIMTNTSAYSQYELFIEYYMMLAYLKTVDLFELLKGTKVNKVYDVYLIILLVYIVTVFILMALVIKLVYTSRDMLNSFLNFIGILPIKFIYEDENLYNQILKIEQIIY